MDIHFNSETPLVFYPTLKLVSNKNCESVYFVVGVTALVLVD